MITPTEIHETLDTRDLLDAAHSPGTYALQVRTPSDVEGIARAFRAVVDVQPPDEVCEQLTSERVCYVGASGDVYNRLTDHARANVRKATFLQCFEPMDVVGVWPDDNPFEAEYNRAVTLSEDGWTCWVDGQVV